MKNTTQQPLKLKWTGSNDKIGLNQWNKGLGAKMFVLMLNFPIKNFSVMSR